MSWLSSSIEHLDTAAKKSAAYSERHFFLFGCLSWCFPVATIIDYAVAQPFYGTFGIRLSVSVLTLPLLFANKLQGHLADRFYLYFAFLIGYGFPFCFGHMLAMNAIYAPEGHQIHMLWIFQYFIALFLFIQFANSGALAILIWTISSVAALAPALWIEDVNWVEVQRVLLYPISGYLTALIFGILSNRNIDIVNTEKVRTAAAIGSNIAHELRTPLASVRSLAHGLKNYLPTLIDGYEKAKSSDLDVDPIRPRQLEEIQLALSTIEAEVEYSNTVIDMLLINTADKPLTGLESDRFDASSTIKDSVSRYPFNNSGERKLINIDIREDFEIRAPQLLVVHVLFNLIKNGLYYVQNAGKGEITISSETGSGVNQIVVHDTGLGIPPIIQKQIFERFYTTTQTGQGAGIGLSFCKMVMESIGGSISCESVEGSHTRFTLTFPSAN
jgi:signal transduction histidine kinase